MNMYNTISIPGAVGYRVKFDQNSNVISSDGLILYKDESHTFFWGSFGYAGNAASGAWGSTEDYELIIYDSSFVAHFYSTSSYESWGFKMYVTPILTFDGFTHPVLEVDSPHNYNSNMNMKNIVFIPGAMGYKVVFDVKSSRVIIWQFTKALI
jgi:hypothetical protein